MAHITVEDAAFLAGLQAALKDEDRESGVILNEIGARVLSIAEAHVARRSGELAGSLGMQSGRDARGPWVDVGTSERYALFVEYGTAFMAAQPFLRPALSMAGSAVRSSGGRRGPASARAKAFGVRARRRGLIRTAFRRGQISSGQALSLSRQVSSVFRVRARRRRP